jgi:4-diphosphocytidyl-2-C-methyl-D-erythritol kinase
VSTKEAFSMLTISERLKSIREIIEKPITSWKDELVNEFEKPVFTLYPAIEKIKNDLYELGALYASMTGTGSTVFGLFEKTTDLNFTFPEHYLVLRL